MTAKPKRPPFTDGQAAVLHLYEDRIKTLEARVMGLVLFAMDQGADTRELCVALERGADRLKESRTARAVDRVFGRGEEL